MLLIKKKVEDERNLQNLSRQYKLEMQENEEFQRRNFFTQLVG
jgi:hypothetical protein